VKLSDRKIWVDGDLVPWADATLHVLSQSAARGSLVFDVLSCHWVDGRPYGFGMREHIERFVNSARLSCMELEGDADFYIAGICETLAVNPGADVVKISGYYPGVALDILPTDARATVAIAALSIRDLIPGLVEGKRRPIQVKIADSRKMPPWVITPQAKLAAGYLYTSVAKRQARAEGYDEILLLDENGDVAEGATQSFFAVIDGELCTAPLDYVLAGITRMAVLDIAKSEGIRVRERTISRQALDGAEEACLAGTAANITPIGRIDERELPEPLPGPITARLMERLEALLEGKDEQLSPRWLQKAF
jgi:branched-chain amino acid aminotransferase